MCDADTAPKSHRGTWLNFVRSSATKCDTSHVSESRMDCVRDWLPEVKILALSNRIGYLCDYANSPAHSAARQNHVSTPTGPKNNPPRSNDFLAGVMEAISLKSADAPPRRLQVFRGGRVRASS